MAYPNYTKEEIDKILELASTRIKNYSDWWNLFGFFFWGMSLKQYQSLFIMKE
jgi:hypothetical protein